MLYLLALLVPPLALLLCGKPFQAIFATVIWVFICLVAISHYIVLLIIIVVWVILAVWSIMVVRDRNTRKMFEETRGR